ncbi:MAG: aspartate aminotransferase family protein [Limisphaerales bacterium]
MSTSQVLDLLRRYESRNVTFRAPDGSWPIVWARARGCHVSDAEGRRYLDLTAAFGVAAAGHANPAVVRAGQRQMATLLHAMGDVHPHELKAWLARALSRLTFGRWARLQAPGPGSRAPGSGKVIFGSSGFEAVEAALKTARLATGRPGVIAFTGGYHGLGYGALNATHRGEFRDPFRDQLREFGHFVPFPDCQGCGCPAKAKGRCCGQLEEIEVAVRRVFRRQAIGAVLVEPVQARGGIRVPPPEFLALLRRLCDEHGALLVLDEIYTGFGRTGAWFACEPARVVPDLICLGKALTGGFPLSACVGRADVMDAAWPASAGEAIHTSTFLGHPVGCAMALVQLAEIRRLRLPARAARLGRILARELGGVAAGLPPGLCGIVRGTGLLAGLELRCNDGRPAGETAVKAVQRMLRLGFLLLPEGAHGEVIGFTPPLTIGEDDLRRAARALGGVLRGGP